MPFMKGLAPIRRTIAYLEKGDIILKDRVKIVAIHLCTHREKVKHVGTREFIFWSMPQLQYKNPDVQIAIFKNLTPTPFIRCYLDNDEQVIFDVDGKSHIEIADTLRKVIGKSENVLKMEEVAKQKKENRANFGSTFARHCICEVAGQVPCPALIPLPKHLRGKFRHTEQS
ncbi:MRPS25 (predicted) [Pycnogonum litorale]